MMKILALSFWQTIFADPSEESIHPTPGRNRIFRRPVRLDQNNPNVRIIYSIAIIQRINVFFVNY